MARTPDDPFWDTVDDVTPPVPRARPAIGTPQNPGLVSQASIVTEPRFPRPALLGGLRPGGAAPLPLGAEPTDPSSPRIITDSLRAPVDMPAPPPGEELQSGLSNHAVMIEDFVRERFAAKSYGRAFYRPRLDKPEASPTADGLPAPRPLLLVPRMDTAPTIDCGWVDIARRDAWLRDFELVTKRHQSQQKGSLPISAQEYDQFLDEMMNTLYEGGLRIMVLVPEEAPAAPVQAAPRRRPIRSFLWSMFLLGGGFWLGLHGERVWAWSLQMLPWLRRLPVWLERVPSWIEWARRLLSWL